MSLLQQQSFGEAASSVQAELQNRETSNRPPLYFQAKDKNNVDIFHETQSIVFHFLPIILKFAKLQTELASHLEPL